MRNTKGKVKTEIAAGSAPPQNKKRLNRPTSILFSLAAEVPALARQFGIEHDDETDGYRLLPMPRPWLKQGPTCDEGELSFDPDLYAMTTPCCSDGERLCRLFILNVWNPGAASMHPARRFDIFKAARVLDGENMAGICRILERNPWP